jgi:acyl dehydratase
MPATPAIVGTTTDPLTFTYDAQRAALYALGIGATAAELDYLYEGRGPKVFPTFAVVPAYAALMAVMARSDIAFDSVVHGHQKVSLARAIPPAATLRTTATVTAVYDLKRMAQVVITTRSHTAEGEHLFDTEWGILVLNAGGFGGEGPPAREGGAPARPPEAVVEETTRPEQALLYRLMGDLNPLHADPDFSLVARFEGRPILHGLCTYGYGMRAVAQAVAGGDATRLREVTARFTKPVWPGDTLRTEVWSEGERVWFRTSTRERGDAVLSHGTARLG